MDAKTKIVVGMLAGLIAARGGGRHRDRPAANIPLTTRRSDSR